MPFDLSLPPRLWLPPKPAIIRPGKRDDLQPASFLPGWFPAGAATGKPPTKVFGSSTFFDAFSTPDSYVMSIGTAAADRFVVVCLFGFQNAIVTVTSITIGGITATPILSADSPAANFHQIRIYGAIVPTGTSATVTVTTAGNYNSGAIGTYAIYGLNSTTAFNTASGQTAGATSVTALLDIPSRGVAIAAATSEASGSAHTATGLTEDADFAGESLRFHLMSAQGMVAETDRTISSSTGGSSKRLIGAVSWR
jgi:hypothetical protein